MRIVAFAIFIATLGGCATKQPPMALYNKCIDAIEKNPAYSPLKDKMSIGGELNQSLAMLSDTSHITEEEKPLLMGWAEDRRACYAADDGALRANTPIELYSLINRTRSASQDAILALYTGKISYGEYAQTRQKIMEAHKEAFAQLAARDRDLRQARSDQVLLMQYQALQNRPPPTPMPAPYMIPVQPIRTTNCNVAGNLVQCTSN